MKIVDLQVVRFRVPAYNGFNVDGHQHPVSGRWSEEALIRIVTDEGAEGVYVSSQRHFEPTDKFPFERLVDLSAGGGRQGSFQVNSNSWDVLLKTVRPHLIGEDPVCRERIWRKLNGLQRSFPKLTDRILAMIDLTLWDLAGKVSKLPVYKLLGGHREKVKAYASTMVGDHYKGGLSTPEEYADYAEVCKKQGYKAFKLHTWMDEVWTPSTITATPDLLRDVEACRAVRERVGVDMVLMLDPYHTYSRQQALTIGRELEKLNYYWLEEPMNEYSVSSYAWLSEQLDIPVIGPESHAGKIYARTEWVIRKAADILRAGVMGVGGLTPFMKIVHLAEAFGIPLEAHSPGVGTLHAIAAMSIPGEYYERGLLHPFLNYDVKPPWLNEMIDPMDEEGFISVPQGPGLGMNINYDYIERHRIIEE